MDPDQALSDLRAIFKRYDQVNISFELQAELGREAREVFEGLDHWMTNGGFRPHDWRGIKDADRTH